MLITNLLLVIILGSCAPATSPTPTIILPTLTLHTIPIATISSLHSEVPYTQDGLIIEPYLDVRNKDLSAVNINLGEQLIETLWFDQTTIWSEQDKAVAQHILKLAMNPGLGVRGLHAEGITGKGVIVAIIDQYMALDHPEFQGKIVKYHDVATDAHEGFGSMHGPAVTSLLVGENVGTAPGAKVYFVAVPSWLLDAQYYADALDWIIAENEKLPAESKIRAVSVSAAPSGLWSPFIKNKDAWDDAYQRVTKAGILVLDATFENGITSPCHYDLHDLDNVAKCIPDWPGPLDSPHKRIFIPTSRRTSAMENFEEAIFSYQYTGQNGGLSWSIPYLTGVLAMGWQINPGLSSSQLLDILYASAQATVDQANIIDPKAFIDSVRLTVSE
ncbi:MAG: hypothetical protein C0410_08745 [Anaerolinea sp.]|nr:hypothetical protein [Anaerolinea sp.]